MVASQMSGARFDNTTVDIKASPRVEHGAGSSIASPSREKKGASYLLRTASSILNFPGFMTIYTEGKDDGVEDEKKNPAIGDLVKGDALDFIDIFSEQKFTQPPPRYTEATLIKFMEQNGIGRPSTYATIISTIQEREYVTRTSGVFRPTELGVLVNDLLGQAFPDIVDIKFTAKMENELDEIANEKRDWVGVIRDFYSPFEKTLEKAKEMEKVKLEEKPTGELCPNCGKPIVIKEGRFGKFLACSGYPECKYTKSIKNTIGVKCPDCGGEILERKSKKGRTFYGCENYPKCKFATSLRPIDKHCQQCGGLLAQGKGKFVRCTKCEYKGRLEAKEAGKSTAGDK